MNIIINIIIDINIKLNWNQKTSFIFLPTMNWINNILKEYLTWFKVINIYIFFTRKIIIGQIKYGNIYKFIFKNDKIIFSSQLFLGKWRAKGIMKFTSNYNKLIKELYSNSENSFFCCINYFWR